MNKKIIKFEDTEIEAYILHQNENPILINNIDINNIILSNKLPFGKQGFKYFTGYKGFEKIGFLYILRPQMIIYKRYFDENRRIYFLIKIEKVFNKYMEILEKVRNIIKTKFNSEQNI